MTVTMHSRWCDGWRMTVESAKVAMTLAPADEQLSAVEPNMKRKDVVYHAWRVLNAIPVTVIDVPPKLARHIASVVQDCADPVELRFAYDPAGEITVGWNKEEVEKRKAPKLSVYSTELQEYLAVMNHNKQTAILSVQMPEALMNSQALVRYREKLAAQQQAAGMGYAAAPKPKPAPDPTDPKFVLKRPKL